MPRVPRDVEQGGSCWAKCWRREEKKKRSEKHSVPCPGLGVPTRKTECALPSPARHKGHNIFSTLSLCIFYSVACLFASNSPPHSTATLCHTAKCLFSDLQIRCRDEGQFSMMK